jgi:hypothetical protein
VVRPPNEEPPPLSDFGWKLWQAGEAVEEWREELRTLYVACTRAEDYLVLSAALKPDLRPEGSWMRLVAERFDLRTGRCLVAGLTPDHVPEIAVTDALRPPPAPPAAAPAVPRQQTGRPAPPTVRASPLPRIITLSELQCLLDGARAAPELSAADVEDESDLHDWLPPRRRTEPQPLDTEARAWIAGIIAGLPEGAVCHRDVQVCLQLPPDDPDISGVVVHGFADLLWQDVGGAWHLAWFHADRLPSGTPNTDWQRRLAGTTLAALAIKNQVGHYPRTVSRYYRWENMVVQRSGSRLPLRRVLADLRRALTTEAEEG